MRLPTSIVDFAVLAACCACASCGSHIHGGQIVAMGELQGEPISEYHVAECWTEPDHAPITAPDITYSTYRAPQSVVEDLPGGRSLLVVTNRWNAPDGMHYYCMRDESAYDVESQGSAVSYRVFHARADEFIFSSDPRAPAKWLIHAKPREFTPHPSSATLVSCVLAPFRTYKPAADDSPR